MSDSAATRQLVVFSLGVEEYALPIGDVQEIVFYTPPRPVSSAQAGVTGVISLRGKIIAVYDLAARLGVPRAPDAAPGAKIVIVETGAELAGIVVDDVAEVLIVSEADLEPLPTATGHPLLEAIAKVGDRLVVLLDLAGLSAGADRDAPPADDAARASVATAA
jgi:purine-binding chemotaxis protein CheW